MRAKTCFVLAAALAGMACATNKVRVEIPPRVDLAGYGVVGMIAFDAKGTSGSRHAMAEVATNDFMALIQRAQAGVPIVELGSSREVLEAVETRRLDHRAVKKIGDHYEVDALLVGELSSEQAKPSFNVQSLTSVQAAAKLEGVLSARLYDTRNGSTVWTNAATGYQDLARLDLGRTVARGALPGMSGQDPDSAEQRLVRSLVETLSEDFESRWVWRKVD